MRVGEKFRHVGCVVGATRKIGVGEKVKRLSQQAESALALRAGRCLSLSRKLLKLGGTRENESQ